MKSKLLSSSVAILSLSLVAAACGDDTSVDGGAGGTGAAGAAGGTGGTGGSGLEGPGGGPIGGTGGTGGSGGSEGDGNDSFAEAEEMTEGNAGAFFVADYELDPPNTDADYFKVELTAGAYGILAFAKYTGDFGTADFEPTADPFDPEHLDTVITIYNSAQEQIAFNDDPYPRNSQDSSVYTILEDGEYFIKIQDFCATTDCPDEDAYYEALNEVNYSLLITPIDGAENGSVPEGAEPNSDFANATAMEYQPNDGDGVPAGFYFLSTCYGDWTDADAADGFTFTAPADVAVEADSRPNGRIIVPPGSINGSGSSKQAGVVEVLIAGEPDQVVASFNMATEDDSPDRAELTFPVVPAQEYLIRINDGPAADGSTPFYFFFHNVGGGNPVEAAEVTNSVIATPEALPGTPNPTTGVTSSFIEGDIPAADVDYFEFNVTDDTFTVTCEALRGGSGATLRAEILSGDGLTSLGTDVETSAITGQLLIEDADVSGETTVLVKIDKTAQAANVAGAFYRCGFHFAPPADP